MKDFPLMHNKSRRKLNVSNDTKKALIKRMMVGVKVKAALMIVTLMSLGNIDVLFSFKLMS